MALLALAPRLRALACAAALLSGTPCAAQAARVPEDDAVAGAAALRARFVVLKDRLAYNQFRRPLDMDSSETANGVAGEIHAVVNHPFAAAGAVLGKAAQWCDILVLHLNTKYCRPSTDGDETVLHVRIGKKHDQPMDEAHAVDFVFRVGASTPDYLAVRLTAAEGPFGTSDYRIVLEAAPAPGGGTLVRLAYAYSFGVVGRIALQGYLGTAGRDKVGFTLVGKERGVQPHLIGGVRGLAERNTMRYYLAIEAFLGSRSALPELRMEKSLRDWFASSERFPRQLHEIDLAEYLAMKRIEYSRQQAGR
jgi:hypothetical protein